MELLSSSIMTRNGPLGLGVNYDMSNKSSTS